MRKMVGFQRCEIKKENARDSSKGDEKDRNLLRHEILLIKKYILQIIADAGKMKPLFQSLFSVGIIPNPSGESAFSWKKREGWKELL